MFRSFMYGYFYSKLPLSFESMFTILYEPNRTKYFKVEKVKNKTLEYCPTVVFPKIWNSTQFEYKEYKSKISFKKSLTKYSFEKYNLLSKPTMLFL